MKKRQEKTLTKQLAQHELVTLAVYLLGGDQHAVDTEDVAIKALELAPGRFSWRKYPEQINLELVRVYLSDAKKSEKGQLLLGSGRTGWSLSKTGLDWAQGAAHRSAGKDLTRRREQSKAGSIDENRWRRERARIQLSAAWKHWVGRGQKPSAREAAEVFRIDSYAVGSIREKKITRLLAISPIAPYDLSRSLQLNPQHPVAAVLLGFIGSKLEIVRSALVQRARDARKTEQARRLEAEAEKIASILNEDFGKIRERLHDIRSAAARPGAAGARFGDSADGGSEPVKTARVMSQLRCRF